MSYDVKNLYHENKKINVFFIIHMELRGNFKNFAYLYPKYNT